MERINYLFESCEYFVDYTKKAYDVPNRPPYLPKLPRVHGVSGLCGVWPMGDFSTFQNLRAGAPEFREVRPGVFRVRRRVDRAELSMRLFGKFAIGYVVGYAFHPPSPENPEERIARPAGDLSWRITVGFWKKEGFPKDLFESSIEYSKDVATVKRGDVVLRRYRDRLVIHNPDCVVTVVFEKHKGIGEVTGDVFYRRLGDA